MRALGKEAEAVGKDAAAAAAAAAPKAAAHNVKGVVRNLRNLPYSSAPVFMNKMLFDLEDQTGTVAVVIWNDKSNNIITEGKTYTFYNVQAKTNARTNLSELRFYTNRAGSFPSRGATPLHFTETAEGPASRKARFSCSALICWVIKRVFIDPLESVLGIDIDGDGTVGGRKETPKQLDHPDLAWVSHLQMEKSRTPQASTLPAVRSYTSAEYLKLVNVQATTNGGWMKSVRRFQRKIETQPNFTLWAFSMFKVGLRPTEGSISKSVVFLWFLTSLILFRYRPSHPCPCPCPCSISGARILRGRERSASDQHADGLPR